MVNEAAQRGEADLAAVAGAIGEPRRARILNVLGDGRALPASLLAREAGVAPSTASTHLGRLVDAGLIVAEVSGRHRYYRLAGPAVAEALEALALLSPLGPVRSLRASTQAAAMRRARACYDHLAGRLGVDVMAALLARGCLAGGDGRHDPARARLDHYSGPGRDFTYTLTQAGERLFAELGVDLRRRPTIRYCVDWSEQEHHLAGGLGAMLLARLLELGWLRRVPVGRVLLLTEAGAAGLGRVLGLERRPSAG
jgi:DNA-binding transcriptional ArsR family regulator